MTRKYNRGISEAQSNALALERRSTPYTDAHRVSVEAKFKVWTSTEAKTLKQLVRDVQLAYSEQSVERLHDRVVGDGDLSGAPRYTPRFAQRLYGSPSAVDTGDPDYVSPITGDRPIIVGYLVRAFDEALAKTTDKDEHRIIWRVAQGGDALEAAGSRGVPAFCQRLVAHDVLARFLGRMKAIKLDLVAKAGAEAA